MSLTQMSAKWIVWTPNTEFKKKEVIAAEPEISQTGSVYKFHIPVKPLRTG